MNRMRERITKIRMTDQGCMRGHTTGASSMRSSRAANQYFHSGTRLARARQSD
jgi:hypothetical protein